MTSDRHLIDTIPKKRLIMLGNFVKKPMLAAALVSLVNPLILLIGFGSVPKSPLVLILFLEGGLGLVSGVIIALSSSPSMSKLGELTLGTARWSREAEKHAENIGSKWMLSSSVLVVVGFIISAI